MILDSPNKSLTITLSGAGSIPFTVDYADTNDAGNLLNARSVDGVTGGTTATVMVAPTIDGQQRIVKRISVANDSGGLLTITIALVNGSSSRRIISVGLSGNHNLLYERDGGWQVIDGDGNIKYAVAAAGLSVTSAEVSAVSAQALSAINVVSNFASNLLSLHDVLSNRVSANSGAGGSGSVTSNEASAISAQAASAINIVSNALSNEISNRASAVNVVSNAASNALSVANAASNAASVVSQALSVQAALAGHIITFINGDVSALSAGRAVFIHSANAVRRGSHAVGSAVSANIIGLVVDASAAVGASVRVQTQGLMSLTSAQRRDVIQAGNSAFSVGEPYKLFSLGQLYNTNVAGGTSEELVLAYAINASTILIQIGSDENRQSNAVSILSQQASATSALIANVSTLTTAGASVRGLQSVVNAISNRISVVTASIAAVSNAVSIVSTAASNALSVANAASNKASAISQFLSAISCRTSAAGASVKGLQSVIDAISNRISVEAPAGGGGGSVTSNEVSAVSAQAASAINVVSNAVSVISQQLSVMSVTVADLYGNDYFSLQNVDAATVSAGRLVYAFTSAATFKRALDSSSASRDAVGILISTTAVSAIGLVQVNGVITLTTGEWDAAHGFTGGLTPGSKYYINGNAIATTPGFGQPPRPVGIALTATDFLLMLSPFDDPSSELASIRNNIVGISDKVSALSTTVANVSTLTTAGTSVKGLQSVINATSNKISVNTASIAVVSNAVSVVSAQVSVLSQAHSALSQQVSVLSSQVSVVSVAVTSVDTRVNTVSNQVSVLSQQVSVISQQVSALSQAHSVLSQQVSALSSQVSTVSAAVTSVDNHVSVVSNQVSVVSSLVSNLTSAHNALSNVVSNIISAGGGGTSVTSNELSVLLNGYSARNTAGTSVHGIQSIFDALSNRISASGGGAGSVTSTELSAVSAQAASAISVLSQAISVLSQQVSVISAGLIPAQMRVLSGGIYTVSATTLTAISGLSISMAASGIYHVEAFLMFTQSVANAVGFGATFPAMANAAGEWIGPNSTPAPVGTSSFSIITYGTFNEAASGSIVYSVAATTSNRHVKMEGLFAVSNAAGTLHLQGRTSAAAAPLFVQKGSYVRAFRVH